LQRQTNRQTGRADQGGRHLSPELA